MFSKNQRKAPKSLSPVCPQRKRSGPNPSSHPRIPPLRHPHRPKYPYPRDYRPCGRNPELWQSGSREWVIGFRRSVVTSLRASMVSSSNLSAMSFVSLGLNVLFFKPLFRSAAPAQRDHMLVRRDWSMVWDFTRSFRSVSISLSSPLRRLILALRSASIVLRRWTAELHRTTA